jgi:hypothetical protein
MSRLAWNAIAVTSSELWVGGNRSYLRGTGDARRPHDLLGCQTLVKPSIPASPAGFAGRQKSVASTGHKTGEKPLAAISAAAVLSLLAAGRALFFTCSQEGLGLPLAPYRRGTLQA